MKMKMNVYHCKNPGENTVPNWMMNPPEKKREKTEEEKQAELVQQFKDNPDSFFPNFLKKP